MKKIMSLLIVLTFFISSFPASAQNYNIKVRVAPFYTEIQGMSVDNRHVEYPLITYKDITYFPMTFDLCAVLGLVCGFDSEKGLFITREYTSYYTQNPNYFGTSATNYYNKLYDAIIPDYPIYLNGLYINNGKEEYPLINFRGVTYFPMTWRFAYEELNFDIEWSEEEYFFKLHNDGKSSPPYAYAVDGNVVKLQNANDVYETTINEEGYEAHHFLYRYYSHYDFDTAAQAVFRRENSETGNKGQMPERTDKLLPEQLEATVKDKSIYIGDALLIDLENEELVVYAEAKEYKLGDSFLIALTVQTSAAPAPYTTYKEYFFKKDSSGIKQIPWDEKNNFSAIYPDGKGGFYITTLSYRPAYSSRWNNSFADIYYYIPAAEKFESMTDMHSDVFNAMHALGVNDGKLYFRGMWYNAEKGRYNDRGLHMFSAINSGYYTLDMKTGKIENLYPYISGETFFGPDKNLYCISDCARVPRIVNLNTGKIIPVK